MSKFKKLLIIPAFNEAKSLLALIEEVKEKAPDYDYIIINDGSTDNTEEICRINNLNALNLPINLGIGGAMQTGYLYAHKKGYDIAVQLDGDGQHDPEDLKSLTEPIENGTADMTIGSRFMNNEGFKSSLPRRIGILLLSMLIYILTGKRYLDVTSGLRAVNKKVISLFSRLYPEDYPETESLMMLIMLKQNIQECSVIMRERIAGKSSIYFIQAVYFMIKVTISIIVTKLRSEKDIKI